MLLETKAELYTRNGIEFFFIKNARKKNYLILSGAKRRKSRLRSGRRNKNANCKCCYRKDLREDLY